MGSTELAANLFRITQTDEVLKNNNVNNEKKACTTHHMVGHAIRETIEKVGGTLPEKLPTPNKSIKENEKRKTTRNKIIRKVYQLLYFFIYKSNIKRLKYTLP